MGLAGAALLTSGFSTWIISTQDSDTSEQITITTGKVTDLRLKAVISSTDKIVNLDADANKTSAGYIHSGSGSREDLEFGCTIQIGKASDYTETGTPGWASTNYDSSIETYFNSFSINIIGDSTNSSEIQTAYNNALETTGTKASIYGFNLFNKSGETIIGETIDSGILWSAATIRGNTLTTHNNTWDDTAVKYSITTTQPLDGHPYREFTFTFKFSRGTFFSNQNPVLFTPSVSNTLDNAMERLNNLHIANSAKFKVVISTTKSAS